VRYGGNVFRIPASVLARLQVARRGGFASKF
jgi:hypothetical protein